MRAGDFAVLAAGLLAAAFSAAYLGWSLGRVISLWP